MDEDDRTNPSQIDSEISNPVVDVGSSDSSRKRKLLAGVLEFPQPKHVCLEHTSLDVSCSSLDRFLGKLPETETESGMAIGHSFSGGYDFAECSRSTYESKIRKTSSGGSSPSASITITEDFYVYKDSSLSSGSSSLTKRDVVCYDFASSSTECVSIKDYEKTLAAEELNQLEFLSSEFVMDGFQQLQDEDTEELICFEDTDAGSYLLSSPRLSVGTQDAGKGTRKPTIDQEFEQYFSSLMM